MKNQEQEQMQLVAKKFFSELEKIGYTKKK